MKELLDRLSNATKSSPIDMEEIRVVAMLLDTYASTKAQKDAIRDLRGAPANAVPRAASTVFSHFQSRFDESGFPKPGAFRR